MSRLNRQQRIDLYRSLFHGRDDVFALRWEQESTGKSGYAPTFLNRSKNTYQQLTPRDIENHLLGHKVLGLYPLLSDNTSRLIVADFDKGNWKKDVLRFYSVCEHHSVPVAIEISRSGNGAHVWCFFAENYPATRSRTIFLTLLREAGCIDEYVPLESFDRLFPNQGTHSGKGLGNLIALPLQGTSRKVNATVFIHPESLEPFSDQWDFLENTRRIAYEQLDILYDEITCKEHHAQERAISTDGVLHIDVNNTLRLARQAVPPNLVTFLRENLNFLNSEYFAKSGSGFSTHTIEKYFKTVIVNDEHVYVPRGHLNKLESFLQQEDIRYHIIDRTIAFDPTDFSQTLELYCDQQTAIDALQDINNGVLVAPPGSGKTVMGLAIALMKRQPTLIITHRQNIFSQWVESIENFLGIPKKEIGRYGGSQKKIIQPFTVAMMQTLARTENIAKIVDQFGCVIIDECHHVPAKSFRHVVSKISSRFLFGLTATPKRKYNDEKLIYAYLGDIVHTVPTKNETLKASGNLISRSLSIHILRSNFSVPYKVGLSDFAHALKLLSHDIERNALISSQIEREIKDNRCVLVLCGRTEHVDALWYFLKGKIDVFTMKGSLSAKQKRYRMKRIKNGTFQVVIATTQLFGEGVDAEHFDSLFLVSPNSYEGKLIQYIGRLRGGGTKKVFDVQDINVELLEKSFKKRMTLYNKMVKSGEANSISDENTLFT